MAKRLKPQKGDSPEVIRYGAPTRTRTLAFGDAKTCEAIEAHITKHIGEPEYVLHEIISELVHIDVHVLTPSKKRPFFYLVTSGMSDLPMKAPREARDYRFAELAIALPGWWKLDPDSLKDERWYWPIRWLKVLARFPHDFETWVTYMHTVPLADEFPAKGTRFDGVIFGVSDEFPDDFWELKVGSKVIRFLAPIPVYPEEMAHRLEHGSDALVDKLIALGDFDAYDPDRPNTCAPSSSRATSGARPKTPSRKQPKREPESK